MAKKKSEEIVEETVETVAVAAEEVVVESKASEVETAEKPKKAAAKPKVKKTEAEAEEVEAAPEVAEEAAVEMKVKAEKKPAEKKTKAKSEATDDSAPVKKKESKRAERVGIVSSDKMMKTVVVRVDRQVKHPIYRKYIKRRKNFMAHDELGSTVGDRVRIVETRPLSARKRWRVVEIIQKAEK
jgi:small subunit ribosomal protein S17